MKKTGYSFIILCFLAIHPAYSQVTEITELFFPYKSGYKFTMRDTTLTYDQYNFPAETKAEDISYEVSNDPKKKDLLVFEMSIEDKGSTKTPEKLKSYLTLNKKGMSWWIDSKTRKGKALVTWAIKTPMKKGTTWQSYFSDKKAKMTCITTDTLIQTIYGNISCFGVQYDVVYQEESLYKICVEVKEFYNIYAGKVHTESLTYILNKTNNKINNLTKSWGYIHESNLTADERKLIVAIE